MTQAAWHPEKSGRARVLVGDDHALVRKGVRALLSTQGDLEVVGEASTAAEVLAEVRRLEPDVLLLDMIMPGFVDLTTSIREIAEHQHELRILVMSGHHDDKLVIAALRA